MELKSTNVESFGASHSFFARFRKFLKQLAERPLSLVGTFIVVLFLFIAVAGPLIAPHGYDEFMRDEDGALMRRTEPSLQHPFGTDKDGRDIFSRVIWGTREIILLPGIATTIAVILGTSIGLTVGYYGGWFDEIVSRLMDSLLSIPALVLAGNVVMSTS